MVEVTVEESIQLPRIHRHPPLLRKVLEAFEFLAIVLGSPVSDGLLLQEGQAMGGCFRLSRPSILPEPPSAPSLQLLDPGVGFGRFGRTAAHIGVWLALDTWHGPHLLVPQDIQRRVCECRRSHQLQGQVGAG